MEVKLILYEVEINLEYKVGDNEETEKPADEKDDCEWVCRVVVGTVRGRPPGEGAI